MAATGTDPAQTGLPQPGDGLFAAAIRVALNLLSGSAGGFAGKIVEYPFDTVKVLLQTQGDKYKGVVDCLRSVVAKHGLTGLYKGLTSPLIGSMAENAVLFAAFDTTYTYLLPETTPHPMKLAISGAMAGVGVSFVLTPVELIKCKLQVENAVVSRYSGPLDCIRQTIKEDGVVRGLFRGHLATMMREVPGNVAWFGTYRTLCAAMAPPGGTADDIAGWKNAVAGGFSGMAYWTAFYPADTVKSQQQTNPKLNNQGFATILKHIYKTEGFRGLYKGWGITVARAMPSNAVIFFTYEKVSKYMRKPSSDDDKPV